MGVIVKCFVASVSLNSLHLGANTFPELVKVFFVFAILRPEKLPPFKKLVIATSNHIKK